MRSNQDLRYIPKGKGQRPEVLKPFGRLPDFDQAMFIDKRKLKKIVCQKRESEGITVSDGDYQLRPEDQPPPATDKPVSPFLQKAP